MSTLFQGKNTAKRKDSVLPISDVDLRQVTVLSGKDWERIQRELHWKEIEEERIRRFKERKELTKEKSNNILKRWPHSLLNLRQYKLDSIKKKKDEVEKRKQALDVEWAEYQAALRREIIQNAKEKQYYRTEKVRTLHSGYLISEVLKEREEQLKLKAILSANEKMREKKWADKEREENEKIMEMDKIRQIELRNHVIRNKAFIQSQIRHNAEQRNKEKEQLYKEQAELDKLADEWRQENKDKIKEYREKVSQNAADNRKNIEENQYIRTLQEKLDEADDKQCQLYANAQRKLMKLRKTREKEMMDERNNHLESILKKLSDNMQKKQDDEDERISKAVAEADALRAADEEEREAKKKEIALLTEKFTREKMEENEKIKADIKKADREHLKAMIELDNICHKNDAEKLEKIKEEKRALRDYHQIQIEQNKLLKSEQERVNDRYDRVLKRQEREDEERFERYAQHLIRQSAAKGRDVYPIMAAAKIKYVPPPNPQNQEERKNLGFIW